MSTARPLNRVGIIGTGWGRTHIGAFRAAGVEVVALLGRDAHRAARIAAEEGVPVGGSDPSVLRACDGVVVATPTPSHLGYLRRFAQLPVLCEKPLSAAPVVDTPLLANQGHYVNYAFAFLRTARDGERALGEGRIGALREARVGVRVVLPGLDSPTDALLEVASHPLSWASHLLGPLAYRSHTLRAGRLSLQLAAGALPVRVRLATMGAPGIELRIRYVGVEGTIELGGRYVPGHAWRFGPALLDGRSLGAAEEGKPDPWYLANCRSVRGFVDVCRGRISHVDAERMGLYGVARAASFERALIALRDR